MLPRAKDCFMEINGIAVEPDLRYREMNLSEGILKALDQKGFSLATPVQAGAIPCFKDWKDVIAKAPTGSGKTFAFGIPMVEHTDPEGTAITIEQNCPLLEVSTVEEMTLTRDILPPLETQEDATMFLGQQRVVQEGQAGQTEVLSRVVKRCGVPVASNDLSAVLLSEPTALIVGTGTKTLPELPDGCLFLWPVQGPITSDFGYRFIFGETNFHRGVDIAAPQGTAINAGADGVVVFSGERGTYGNLVILSHENGFLTYYAHCSKLLVQPGDIVTQGQPIAAVGSTGRSTGPHCHFEVRYQNEPIDPLLYLPGENNAPARSEVPEEEEEKPTEEETTPPEEETPMTPPETPAVPQKPVQPQPPAEPTPPADPVVPEDPAPPTTGEDPDAEAQPTAPDTPDQGTT